VVRIIVKRFYCTYFDRNYLVRGLALIRSLQEHSEGDWELFVVCMDEETRHILERFVFPNVTHLSMTQIEAADPELASAKNDRTRVEYLWTTTPAIILWLIESHPGIDLLTYLDADLYFYSSPEPIFAELGADSILIHEHRYTPELRDMEINGKYNVGLLSFRADTVGKTALRWWRERCIESCVYDVKNGKCGDQVYLNDWPERFPRVHVLEHHGAGVAPWNVDQYAITKPGKHVLVDGVPLIFYHFHALSILAPQRFRLAYRFYVRDEVAEVIYGPYTRILSAMLQELQRLDPSFHISFKRPSVSEKAWEILFASRLTSRGVAFIRRSMRQAGFGHLIPER